MNGIVNVYKVKGMTSHDVVNRLRRIFKTKAIGHNGTLDPNAEGVLVVAVGKATRILEYLPDSFKGYEGELVFGATSDTDDLMGAVVKVSLEGEEISLEDLDRELAQLEGRESFQIPPMYSSIKIGGKKLYEYARQGETVEREARPIFIKELKRISEIYSIDGYKRVKIKALVSKGTYIRSLCVDLGAKIGVPSVMGELTRTTSGGFKVEDSLRIEELEGLFERGDLSFLKPLEGDLLGLRSYSINEEEHRKIMMGQKIAKPEDLQEEELIVCLFNNKIVTIGKGTTWGIQAVKNIGE